jgi:hypothetical protein
MRTNKWGQFDRIMTISVMLFLTLGGAVLPGTANAQGT